MNQQLVKSLLVEIDASTEKLRRALREGGVELDTFAKKSEQTGKTSSTAASATASRQANAARAIAMTTETIARQGKVSGEAAKQLLAQGSNMAFMFGPTGALVGAIGIATLAIATMFNRTKREMEEAAEKAEETIARLINAGDSEGLKARARELYLGTAADRDKDGNRAPFTNNIRDRRARIAVLEAQIAANPYGALGGNAAADRELKRLREELIPLEREYKAVTDALLNFTRPLETRTNPAIKVTAQSSEAAAKELEKLEREFERAAAEAARAIAAFDKEAADFGAAFDQAVLRELGSNVDRVAASFDRLIEQGTRIAGASDPRVVQLREMKAAAVAAARAAEELERVQARKRKVATLEGKVESVLKEGARSAADIAREIQQAVDGALQLAAAFGAIDERATTALRSIAQIAGNIPALQTALSAGSGTGVLSASLPILGAFASLLGDSPAERQRREELRANTQAIRELTKRAGLLGIGVTGGDAASAQLLLQDFLGRVGGGQIVAGGRSYNASDQATIAAERLGILDELQAIAAEYGITLNRNISSFEQLRDVLQDTITKLGEFGTDLDSALQQANAEAEIFGVTDPLERLGLTQDAYRGRSPVLDQLTAGLDLSTAEGRARARENAQELFNTLKAGGDTLSADQLGGLTGQQLIDAILQLVSGLNDIDENVARAAGSSLGGISGFRGLTEAAGERMADYLKAIVGQGSEHLQVLRAQLAELTRIAATPFTLPAIPGVTVPLPASVGTTFAAGAVTVTMSGDIVVQLQGSTTDPAGLGLQVSRAVREQIEEVLYDSLSRALRARGDVSITPGMR